MEITRHLLIIVILHLSPFYCQANMTSVKVSEFRQPAVLAFSDVCCLVAWCTSEACSTRGLRAR